MKNKIILMLIFSLMIFSGCQIAGGSLFVYADGLPYENYVIYNENGDIICEKSQIEIGDEFITADFSLYKITHIDNHKGYAVLVEKKQPPKISTKKDVAKDKMSQRGELKKKICLYMTHNDESYTPTDGYDSIYGKGGIHDVAKDFKEQLEKKGIQVILDESLHIPHNNTAYSRSAVTAQRLLNEQRPDAMFDVHRDGVSKSYYYVTNNGKSYSKIRMVLGKSNPNFNENFEFAQTLFALGNDKYPFLFSDIYLGKGHYNQALQPTALLFEMGTYLIEKEYVLNSLPLLAEVVDTSLFGSKVDEEGNIIVDETVKPNDVVGVKPPNFENNNDSLTDNNQTITEKELPKASSKGWIAALVLSIFTVFLLGVGGIILKRKEDKENTNK